MNIKTRKSRQARSVVDQNEVHILVTKKEWQSTRIYDHHGAQFLKST